MEDLVEQYLGHLESQLYDPKPGDEQTKEEQLEDVRETLTSLVQLVIIRTKRQKTKCPLRFNMPLRQRWCIGCECEWWTIGPDQPDPDKGVCAIHHLAGISLNTGWLGA